MNYLLKYASCLIGEKLGPCSNGIIDKFNGTLGKNIRSFVDKNASNLNSYIGILMSAYRSTPHTATGFSPNMLMFGREVLMPNSLMFPLPKINGVDHDTYIYEVKDTLEEIYHLVRQNLNASAVAQKKNYDTRLSQTQFQKGSLVYKYNSVFKKFEERWSGPYVVTGILSPVLYKIEKRREVETVHHDKLKLYLPDDVPVWVQDVRKKIQ